MKHNVIRYSVALLLGLVALTAGRTSAQGRYKEVIIESSAWGVSTGETRVSAG